MIIFKIALTVFWICTTLFLIGWLIYEWIYAPSVDDNNTSGRSENDPVRIWNKHKRGK